MPEKVHNHRDRQRPLPNTLLNDTGARIGGELGNDAPPISIGGVEDLRRLLLRTLNDNQLLILSRVAVNDRPLTGLLIKLSEETGVPLSTLKLNARILRELNLISYGSVGERREAEVEPVGALVLRLMDAPGNAKIRLYD
jgi:hypothetical protein